MLKILQEEEEEPGCRPRRTSADADNRRADEMVEPYNERPQEVPSCQSSLLSAVEKASACRLIDYCRLCRVGVAAVGNARR